MLAIPGWLEMIASPDWVIALGTLAALGLSAYSIYRQRRETARQRNAADKAVGANAYALKGLLSAWSTNLNKVQGAPPDTRARVYREIFGDMGDTDRRFSRLTATASNASADVREDVAEATVLYHEVAKRVREAARDPKLQRTIDAGQTPHAMDDAAIADLLMFLRSSRGALSRLSPEEIRNAREVYWPTRPNDQ